MKESKFAELSNEALLKNEKRFNGLMIAQIVALALLIFAAVVITLKKGFGLFTIFPLIFVSFVFISLISLREIRKEIQLRQL